MMLTQNIYIKISVGSRRRSKLFHFSLSTLEIKEKNFNILFLLSKVEKCISNFSFSSQKLRIFFLISLSLLETGEREFRFLFLLSKLEKLFSNFSSSSRFDFFASRQPLAGIRISTSFPSITCCHLIFHRNHWEM